MIKHKGEEGNKTREKDFAREEEESGDERGQRGEDRKRDDTNDQILKMRSNQTNVSIISQSISLRSIICLVCKKSQISEK